MQALQGLGDAEPPPGFAARVVERIETPRWWERVAESLVYPLRVKLPIHAAALVALCLAGLWMFHGSPTLQRAADLRAPAPLERPASATPQAPVAPPASARKDESARHAPRPSSEGKRETATAAREPAGVGQTSAVEESVPAPAVPPPSAAGKTAEAEPAAPRLLRSAQAPVQVRERAQTTLPAGSGTADEIFSAAATAFAAQQYESAIDALRAFLAQYPSDSRAPDARFLLAEAYRASTRYAESRREFETFLRQYPDHRRAPTVLYRYGEVVLLLGDPLGCALLRDALNKHPNAREAASAREMVSARCP
jgi:TolA-binding protein